MLLDSFFPIQLEIVDISKTKVENDKALYFEMDVIMQMLHLLKIEEIDGVSIEVNSISTNVGEDHGSSSFTYTLPITFCNEFTEELNFVIQESDQLKKAELFEGMIVKYAIKSNNAAFFNELWSNKRYATCRFVFDSRNREP